MEILERRMGWKIHHFQVEERRKKLLNRDAKWWE
jgi:hypothetical protein